MSESWTRDHERAVARTVAPGRRAVSPRRSGRVRVPGRRRETSPMPSSTRRFRPSVLRSSPVATESSVRFGSCLRAIAQSSENWVTLIPCGASASS